MYNLTVVNNYSSQLSVDAGGSTYPVVTGESLPVPLNLGDAAINVPGIGHMLLHDVADRQIGGFSKATWGVYLSYQGEELVFRYEGGGQIAVTFNDFGQAAIETNGAVARISLGAFRLPGE